MRLVTACIAALVAATPTLSQGGPPIEIAVLQEAVVDVAGHPHRPVVRIPFEKRPDGWSNVANPLPEGTWTACFDGRAIGTVRARASTLDEPHMLEGVHDPLPGQRLPFHGSPTMDWADWAGGPVHRPVVLSSAGRCADPARWRPAPADPAVRKAAIAAYRAAVPMVPRCDGEALGSAAYPESAISFGKVYRDRAGEWIFTLGVRLDVGALAECTDVIEGGGMRTFALRDGAVTPLGEVTLIDAGDYDGDGRSELVFVVHGYDEDGYVLLDADLRTRQEYTWNYH